MGTTWHLGRRPGLDGLRGVAILFVVVSHVFDAQYLNAGPVGVTVFFALSGFLITSLLLEERVRAGSVSLGRFYARRTRRLLPALVVMLVAMTALQGGMRMHPYWPAVAVLFYVANWAAVAGLPMGLFSHAWSLAIEEQFYLVFPLVLVLRLRRMPVHRLVRWFLAALQSPRWSSLRVLRWLGARSYGLYLWHVPLVYGLPWYLATVSGSG